VRPGRPARSFVGFGDPDSGRSGFLRALGELAVPGKRVVGDAGFFPAGTDPQNVSDAELYDRLAGEFPAWPAAARARGIVPPA
jgi:hypothetical protein